MRIIRELGRRENSKLSNARGQRFTSSIRVTTSLDIFSRLGLLNRTIRLWMSSHPLLRANIVEVDGKKNFVHDERFGKDPDWLEDESDLENVKYLVVDPSRLEGVVDDKKGIFEELAYLISERELNSARDYSKELLWSLSILEIPSIVEREYDIALLIAHSISEGRNPPVMLVQLLDLVERVWDSAEPPAATLREFAVPPSVEDLYFTSFDQSKHSNERMRNLPLVSRANYVDEAAASRCPLKSYEWADQLSNEWVYRLVASSSSSRRTGFVRLGQLAEDSKSFHGKSRRFTFSREETSRLVEKSKQEGCTVNLALVNLVAFSLRKLSDLTGPRTADERVRTNAYIPISLRQFEPTLAGFKAPDEFTDQLAPGFHITATILPLDSLNSLDSDALDDVGQFWKCCRLDSARFQAIIEGREMFFENAPRSLGTHETDISFVLSNIGRLPHRLPNKYALSAQQCFSVERTHTEVSISTPDYVNSDPFYVFISTCNGRLSFSFFYNSFVLSHARAEKATELLVDLFKRLIA